MNAFVRNEVAALVVDANPEIRQMMVRALRAGRVSRIWEASDCAGALASLELAPVTLDLVVLDSSLRTADGTALVRRLIARQKPPSFIFLRRAGQVNWSATEVDVRSRGLTVLGTVDTASTMAGVQRLLEKLIPVGKMQAAPVALSYPSLSRAVSEDIVAAASSGPEGPDVATYLLKVRERCQKDLLNKHGITCVMDLDSGSLSPWRCRIVGGIVQALIIGICNGAGTFNPKASIAVGLHHLDDVWILSVAEHGFSNIDRPQGAAEFDLARTYARPLNGEWHTRMTATGAITTFRFSVDPQPRNVTPSEMLSTDEVNYFRASGEVSRFNETLK